jgi:tetratricopeptide (TPR) repeat protein
VLEPGNLEIWRILAGYYLKLRDFRKAVWAHRELVTRNPQDAVAQRNLAACYQNIGIYDEALKHWRRALELNGEGAGAKKARQNIQSLERYLASHRKGPSGGWVVS